MEGFAFNVGFWVVNVGLLMVRLQVNLPFQDQGLSISHVYVFNSLVLFQNTACCLDSRVRFCVELLANVMEDIVSLHLP